MAGAYNVFQDAIHSYFGAVSEVTDKPQTVMEEIGAYLVRSTKNRFVRQTDPTGKKWAPNSPVTLALKAPETRILTHHGYLARSIKYTLVNQGKGVSVGSDLVYAAMMQYGGKKAQFPHLWGDIPARPFLGLSQENEKRIQAIIKAHLVPRKVNKESAFGRAGRAFLNLLVRILGG